MAAPATQNPQVQTESKSAKKKKAKATSSGSEISAPADVPANGSTESNSGDGPVESPYLKNLYKNLRNINKKIANASKVDGIVNENPGKTLDQLITERKINADQKAQALKKPDLKQQLQQYEELIQQCKSFEQAIMDKFQAERVDFEKTYAERANKELAEAVASAKAGASTTAVEDQERNFLLLSQFLRLAAIRRGEDEDPELEENKALEGLLASVYTGDAAAVASIMNLVNGSDAKVMSVGQEPLNVTYADIKKIALAQLPPTSFEPEPVEETEGIETPDYPVQSDPTIANASLTEIDEPAATVPVDGHSSVNEVAGIPQNSGFGGEGGANAAATQNWDQANELSNSQDWVKVPRDAAETDTELTATPAANNNVQSWADDQPDSPTETSVPPPVNDNEGFQSVPQRTRGGRGDRGQGGQYRGNNRGRGRGEYRGRGDGRGRGRGGRGGPRRGDD